MQPAGYRDGIDYVPAGALESHLMELTKHYVALPTFLFLNLTTDTWDYERLFPLDDPDLSASCPIHIIGDDFRAGAPVGSYRIIQCIERIRESKKFVKS